MPVTRTTIDESAGIYNIEVQFKDKDDFIKYISRFQPRANELGLSIQLVQLPEARHVVDKI